MLGSESYVDPAKDTWRGWKWNRIANAAVLGKPLPPAEKSRQLSRKTVLYLVGPEDRDRPKALAKGFANHNLIAVDIDKSRVAEVRKKGCLSICGSMQQVLLNWSESWSIDVIDCDFCHGITRDAEHLIDILFLCKGVTPHTVLSMNFLRGRDEYTNFIRRNLSDARWSSLDKHHRGVNWMYLWLQLWSISRQRHKIKPGDGVMVDSREYYEITEGCGAQFSSYRSKTSGQYFDSVVHTMPLSPIGGVGLSQEGEAFVRDHAVSHLSKIVRRDSNTKGRVAALRAVRTVKARSHE